MLFAKRADVLSGEKSGTMMVGPKYRGFSRTLVIPLVLSAVAVTTASHSTLVAAQTEAAVTRQVEFAIQSGPLSDALNQLAQTAGLYLIGNGSLTKNKTSAALNGRYSVDDALKTLLKDSGLGFRFTDENTVQLVTEQSSALNLESIEVTGKHYRDVGATGLPLAIGDTPQSISVVDNEYTEFYDLNTIGDALSHGAAIYSEDSLSNRTRFVFSRGFEMNRFLIDGMGAAGRPFNTTLLDPIMFETVEVIRGSTGMLQEVGQPSGTVNLIQKRAEHSTGGTVAAEYGSWNRRRVDADLNVALNESGSVRGRVVTAAEASDSFVDRVSDERNVFYGTLTADVTDALQVSVFGSLQDDDQNALSEGLPYQFSNGERFVGDKELNLFPDWADQSTEQASLMTEVRYQLNDRWSLQARAHRSDMDDKYVYAGLDTHIDPDGDYALFTRDFHRDYGSKRLEAGLNGSFGLLGRDHDLNFTVADTEFKETQWMYNALDPVTGNLYAEQSGAQAMPAKPAFDYENGRRRDAKMESRSIRAALNLNLLDNFNLLLGANHKRIESHSVSIRGIVSDTEFSDTNLYYGGVYRLNDQTKLYASYTDVFDQQQTYDVNGELLEPLLGKNTEAGVRYSTDDGRLSVDVAYFQIEQDNYPVRAGQDPDTGLVYYVAQSGIESQGFEIELTGYLTDQWSASFSYSHTDVTNPNYTEDRVSRIVPDEVAKLSTSYDFDGDLQGLRVGGYVTYAGSRQGFIGSGRNTQYIDMSSHTLVGLAANYELTDQLNLKLNIHNLFDEEYDSKMAFFTVRPGEPRNLSLQLSYLF